MHNIDYYFSLSKYKKNKLYHYTELIFAFKFRNYGQARVLWKDVSTIFKNKIYHIRNDVPTPSR